MSYNKEGLKQIKLLLSRETYPNLINALGKDEIVVDTMTWKELRKEIYELADSLKDVVYPEYWND